MLLDGKKVTLQQTNATDIPCPMCNKTMRYREKCCSSQYSSLVCTCGYKELIRDDKAIDGTIVN